MDYQYPGMEIWGSVGQVNKNIWGVSNDLVEMILKNEIGSKINNTKMQKCEIYFSGGLIDADRRVHNPSN